MGEKINERVIAANKSILAQQEAKIQELIDAGLDMNYIATHYTIIKGPMNVTSFPGAEEGKMFIKVSQFWELCPNERLQERLKELEKQGRL